jgi:hypothetical protein
MFNPRQSPEILSFSFDTTLKKSLGIIARRECVSRECASNEMGCNNSSLEIPYN